jgi:hypothetical protein
MLESKHHSSGSRQMFSKNPHHGKCCILRIISTVPSFKSTILLVVCMIIKKAIL